jgi:NitT/TauT family transport system substrate-binding protein
MSRGAFANRCAAFLVGAAALIAPAAASSAFAAAPEEVNFLLAAPPTLPAFGPLVVAKQLGFYSSAGYDVHFQVAHGGIEIATNVGAGNAPFGLSLGDAPIVVRGRGIPIKIVAMMGGGALGVLVARKDHGIAKIEDLRNKKISVMSYSEANYYATLAALAAHGIKKSDVQIQAVGPAGVTSLVIAGATDACICTPDWEVNVEDAVHQTVAMPLKDYVPTTAQAIVSSDEMIAKRPEFIRGVVQASLKGMRAIMDDPIAAAKVFVTAVPAFTGKEDLIIRIFKNYIDRTYSGQKVMGETNPETLAAMEKLYLEQGVITQSIPVDQLYTNQFVK